MLESLFNKVAGILACNFIKKRLQHRCFPLIIQKFSRMPILNQRSQKMKCLFMSEVMHSLLSKVYTKTLFSKRNIVQCKILIQHFPSWKQRSPPSLLDLIGKINSICQSSSKNIEMFSIFVLRKKNYLNLFLADVLFQDFYILV